MNVIFSNLMGRHIRFTAILFAAALFPLAASFGANPVNGLRIDVITAYNLVVDSNVESPSTYAPRSAFMGAKFYNDGSTPLSNVVAYIGDYKNGINDTPGIYPRRAHPPLVGPLLPGDEFALNHEGGSSGTADATRYLGTIAPNTYKVCYWLIGYPNVDANGDAVWGPSIKPDDDLWLQYDVWSTATRAGSSVTSDVTKTVTMRNEISAMANKIYPNTASKVPNAYLALLDLYQPSWYDTDLDGSVGTLTTLNGVWYDLGTVGEGFDNNNDFVPDRNAWMQPVGDPALFDSSCTRLVHTYAMVVVKLKTGGEEVYMVDDQLYFENVPDNNGAVGLVMYEFVPLKPGCSSQLSPYQEVASGYDNEKFNGDYGAAINSPIVTGPSYISLNKTVNKPSAQAGSDLWYAIAYSNAGTVQVGDFQAGTPLVIQEAIPTGTLYVAGTATPSNTLPSGVSAYLVFYSTNNATSWSQVEPVPATNVTHIQWWLNNFLLGGATGVVRFAVTIRMPYTWDDPRIVNTAGLSFGSTAPFVQSNAVTTVSGTNRLGDTVFLDDGTGSGGLFGDGLQNGSEQGIPNITVWLYYDANTNSLWDSSDILVATTSTAANGSYLFSELPDSTYVAVVDTDDPQLPYGCTITTSRYFAADLDFARATGSMVSFLNADFGFAPALLLDKAGATQVLEGNQISYTIAVSNRIPGDGGITTFNVFGTNGWTDAGQKAWVNYTKAFQPPGLDGVCATALLANAREDLLVYDFFTPQGPGNITNVEIYIRTFTNGQSFNAADKLDIYFQKTNTVLFTTTLLGSQFGNSNVLFNVTTCKTTWAWTDFSPGCSNIVRLYSNPGGSGNGQIAVDSVWFRILTDQSASASSNSTSTLDPVPLFDTYDADLLQFVSASPIQKSVQTNGTNPNSVGTIRWDNVGPIFAGGGSLVTVTFNALQPPTNMATTFTNTAFITNATYASGKPANSSTDTVTTTTLPTGSIGDYVWYDANNNRIKESDELGLANISVVLWPPVGVNLGSGPGKPVTNQTDSSGYYLFSGLPSNGVYTTAVLIATVPSGFTNTTDGQGLANNTNIVTLTVTATDGSDVYTNADFGYHGGQLIEGTIWHDWNQGGTATPDTGEEWLTNVIVRLYVGDGTNKTLLTTTTNNANGYFRFAGAYTAGVYTVAVVTNTGQMTNQIWTESYDTDGVSLTNQVVFSLVTGTVSRADFSYYRTGTYTIGDTLFYDWDGNGLQNTNEEGIANITVWLYSDDNRDGIVNPATDSLIATKVTATNGTYLFTGLGPGSNYLVVVDQADPQFPLRYNNTADPYGINDGKSLVTITTSNRLDQDFGYQPYGSGSIGDTVWRDMNASGTQSGPSEPNINNITVTLYADFNYDGTYLPIRTTVTTNTYLFNNLPDGNYRVAVSTNDTDLPSDAFGYPYVPTTPVYYDVTITNGNSILTCDFGFAPLGAIGDTIFWDANRNGTQDWSEDGIENVVINLYRDINTNGTYDSGIDTYYGSDVTDANGNYLFSGLPTGTFVVVVSDSGPIAGKALSADPSSDGVPCSDPTAVGCDSQYGTRIYPGTSFMGADFGYIPSGVLGDTLWIDTDSDGTRGSNEVGIAYVTVSLYTNGVLMTNTETDADGYYLFMALPNFSNYLVRVETNDTDFPQGVIPTYDADGTLDNRATNIIMAGGVVTNIGSINYTNASLNVDFGYRYAGANSLSGTVGLDDPTYNGLMGTGATSYATNEVPYGGVTVYLYLWSDKDGDSVIDSGEYETIGSALTSTNGDYSFTSLPAGSGVSNKYVVSIGAPEDNLYLTTISGINPGVTVKATTNLTGEFVSAYQTVPIAAAVTNIDFAFRSLLAFDFGDLPQTYKTLLNGTPSGARHIIAANTNLYLGAEVDSEINGQPSTDATGDGSDEDGVTPVGVWQNGTSNGAIRVTIGKGEGWLTGFIDFANDGDMTDYGDLVVNTAAATNGGPAANGIYTSRFTITSGTIQSDTTTVLYARFRLFPEEQAFPQFAYAGLAQNGEVEDYCWVLGSLGDLVWKDINGDGVKDASEPTLSNVRVFVDLNGDNLYQTNEPSALTSTSGVYHIGGFSTGAFSIAVDTNSLYSQYPYLIPSYDLNGVGTPHYASVTMTTAQVRSDVDFGYMGMAMGGSIWYDYDANGLQDETTYTWISNVTVYLLDYQSNLVTATTTDTNGFYLFDIPTPGNYYVEFFPINYRISPRDTGANDELDSDSSTNAPYRTIFTTISAGERDFSWDMGVYRPVESNTVGDFIWFDYDRDGAQDTNESGIAGVTVRLYDVASNLVNQTVSDLSGYYYFSGLTTGTYFVQFVTPAEYYLTLADQGGNDQTDSDADTNTGRTLSFFVTTNVTDLKWDAGFCKALDVGVTKTINNAGPDEGETIWWTITLTNYGPVAASQLQLTDVWPATGITYVAYSTSTGSYTATNGIWNIGNLATNSGASLTLTGTVQFGTVGKTFTNSIRITSLYEADTNLANNASTSILTVAGTDLAISKSVQNSVTNAGSNVVYTIVVTNLGPKNATGVKVTEPLTNNLTHVTNWISQGTYAPTSGIWNIGNLNVGSIGTLVVTATVSSTAYGTYLTNVARITSSDQAETSLTNNTARAIVTVIGADLALSKTAVNEQPVEGEDAVYKIVVTNRGPSTATGIQVYEPLTNGLTYLSSNVTAGVYSNSTKTWYLNSLAAGASETLTITASFSATYRAITNFSRITTNDVPDPNPANNYDTAIIYPSNLKITKQCSVDGLAAPGTNMTYTIIVTNNGLPPQTGVIVTDTVPAGVVYTPGTASNYYPFTQTQTVRDVFNTAAFTNNSGTIPWRTNWIETGEADGAGAGNVTVGVDPTTFSTNVLSAMNAGRGAWRMADLSAYRAATLTFKYRRDGLNSANDYMGVYASSNGGATWVQISTLGEQSGSDPAYLTSTNIDITRFIATNCAILFTNITLGNGEFIRLDDINIYVERRQYTNAPSVSPPTTLATNHVVEIGEFMRISYDVTVPNPPTRLGLTNFAFAGSDLLPSPRRASTTNPVTHVDLGVTKTIDDAPPGTIYSTNYYTIVVTNYGVATATEVVVTDTWPSQFVSYVTAVPQPPTTYDSNTHVWTVGTLPPLAGSTLVITGVFHAAAGSAVTNRAYISNVKEYESNKANNTDEVAVVTLVVVSRFESGLDSQGPFLEWETASEIGTAGFYLLRIDANGRNTRVQQPFIPAFPARPEGAIYRVNDPLARPGSRHTYLLQEIESSGRKRSYGPYTVTFPRTTTVRDTSDARRALDDADYQRRIDSRAHEQARLLSTGTSQPTTLADPGTVPAVKILTDAAGACFVTPAELATITGSDSNSIRNAILAGQCRISNKGAPVAARTYSDGSIGFYAQAMDSLFTRSNVYVLSWTTGTVMRAETNNPQPVAADITQSHATVTHFEQDRFDMTGLTRDPDSDYWFWDGMLSASNGSAPKTFAITLEPASNSSANATLTINLRATTSEGLGNEHHARIYINNTSVGDALWSGTAAYQATFQFNHALLITGSNSLSMVAFLEPGISQSVVLLDSFDIAYQRANRAQANALALNSDSNLPIIVSGFSTNDIDVWDITAPSAPFVVNPLDLAGTAPNFRVAFNPPTSNRTYHVFSRSAGSIARSFATQHVPSLASTTNAVGYLLITTPALVHGAERLRDRRAAMGLPAAVVTLDAIYDEFSFGIPDPAAIRSLLAYATANWRIAPAYLVLVGSGTYDYRNLRGYGDCLVPPVLERRNDGIFAWDGWYADIDQDGLPELAVGRIPVLTAAELDAAVNRIISSESSYRDGWQTNIVLLADDADSGGDFRLSSEQLAADLPTSYSRTRIYRDEHDTIAARAMLHAAINNGAAFINYFGHAGVGVLAADSLLTSAGAAALINSNKLFVVTAMSCSAGRFSIPGADCIGEALVLAPTGGAVAVWMPEGTAENRLSLVLAQEFYRAVTVHHTPVLGDAILESLAGYADTRLPTDVPRTYNLLGDPALLLTGVADGLYPYKVARVTYSAWVAAVFGRLPTDLDPAYTAPGADFDGDGTPNFDEYAFGRNPLIRDSAPALNILNRPSNSSLYDLVLKYTRRTDATDLDFSVDVSGDLLTWFDSGSPFINVTVVNSATDAKTQDVYLYVKSPRADRRNASVRLKIRRL